MRATTRLRLRFAGVYPRKPRYDHCPLAHPAWTGIHSHERTDSQHLSEGGLRPELMLVMPGQLAQEESCPFGERISAARAHITSQGMAPNHGRAVRLSVAPSDCREARQRQPKERD
jgi:hypothetical protein